MEIIMREKLLAKRHTGMKISCSGLLGRLANGQRMRSDHRRALGEMLEHLEAMAKGYYEGNVTVVDEFLQLSNLGQSERESIERKILKDVARDILTKGQYDE